MNEIDKEFELWAKEHKFNISRDKTLDENGRQIYSNPMTQGAYMAFNHAMDIAATCLRFVESGHNGESIN